MLWQHRGAHTPASTALFARQPTHPNTNLTPGPTALPRPPYSFAPDSEKTRGEKITRHQQLRSQRPATSEAPAPTPSLTTRATCHLPLPNNCPKACTRRLLSAGCQQAGPALWVGVLLPDPVTSCAGSPGAAVAVGPMLLGRKRWLALAHELQHSSSIRCPWPATAAVAME